MILSIAGLTINYRKEHELVRAVEHASLEVNKDEVVAIVGESGSGKTTVALSIPQLLPPAAIVREGRIQFNGKDMLSAGKEELSRIRGKEISMIFQDPTSYLNPLMKIGDQIAEVLVTHDGLSKDQAEVRVKSILEEVRVPDAGRVYHYYPNQLSGGMAQRVLIGAAIACGPSLLVADEPTSGLDLTVQAQILNLLKNLKKKLGTSILMVTHDMGVVSGLADRILIMYAGQVMEEGDIRLIFSEPKHPYTRLLMQASKVGKWKDNRVVEIPGSVPDLANPPPGCRFGPRCPHFFDKCTKDPPEITESHRKVFCWLWTK